MDYIVRSYLDITRKSVKSMSVTRVSKDMKEEKDTKNAKKGRGVVKYKPKTGGVIWQRQ